MTIEETKMNGVFASTPDECNFDLNPVVLNDKILDNILIKKRAGITRAEKIAYIGGSISIYPPVTSGPNVKEAFIRQPWHLNLKETLRRYNILVSEERNFSIGGVGAFFTVFNLTEILKYSPDIVFIDFTVNEIGTKDYIILEQYNRILSFLISNQINCCIIHNYHVGIQVDFDTKKIPNAIRVIESIADQLNVPSINLAQYFGNCVLENKLTKADFLVDSCHLSSAAFSHIGDFYEEFNLKDLFTGNATITQQYLPEYKNLHIHHHSPLNGLREVILPDKQTQGNIDVRVVEILSPFVRDYEDVIPYIWENNQSVSISFHGRWLFIHDIMGPTNGRVRIKVNNGAEFYVKRFDANCSEQFRNNFIAIDCKEIGSHEVELTLVQEHKKTEILLTRNKTLKEPKDLNDTISYIIRICSLGK